MLSMTYCIYCIFQLNVKQIQFESGKMIPAHKYGATEDEANIELTEDENKMVDAIKVGLINKTVHEKHTIKCDAWNLELYMLIYIMFRNLHS